ncbi:hypothetical protein [Streptomyces sp. AM8-1-1]|uniref:hypothetical protein n=1 Tax=Streptomyces sp. AM8-1-1 TaxID=3075825 RepID=UPI0028C4BFE4|nr:hypothetical protein [Streptomyces sp. AM8-1-1]WNO70159.1 hypothetical protein RPQ07_00225 [Streptomyces sp. AM8-1-1]WNO76957.1 hypothetical protein RPQ07_37500 [Streptomyces sp. AM8-1-1]
MMTDYNVSDHWSADDPDWLKSLVSSLDRHHGVSTILPLTVIAEEVLEWLELASGVDAWKNGANRRSLRLDLDESIGALGALLRVHIAPSLAKFQAAFSRLDRSPAAVLKQPPGTRTGAVWAEVTTAAKDLLEALDADVAVRASWDDLVDAAQDRTLEGREYRPIADLLFDQLRRRGLSAERIFRDLVSVIAYGRDPHDVHVGQKNVPLKERIARARAHVSTPAKVEPIVVWLGYLGGQAFPHLSAGRVSFMNAYWAVPNAGPGGQNFEHRAELWELVRHGGLFQVAKLVDEESDVDFLVRVDLGRTTAAGALNRAVRMVNTILNVSIHNSGGVRPHLAQHGLLRSGQVGSSSLMISGHATGFPDDHYGAGITARAIEEHGPRIASALANGELPRFLAAALEVQTTADHPFSRAMALRKPSEADISSVIPLADRVVQHIAAHAALAPKDLFDLLSRRWPHARWLVDVRRAVQMCLLGGGSRSELRDELTREWLANKPPRPWILFVTDRSDDLLSLCRIESERAWIKRMFASVSDYNEYRALIEYYAAEGAVLEARRGRVRNALVHGNPAGFAIVESVREYAKFLSGRALNLGLESYAEGTTPAVALTKRTDEFIAMQAGQDAASYWRDQLRARAATSAVSL